MQVRTKTKNRWYNFMDYNEEDVKCSWYPVELQKITDT